MRVKGCYRTDPTDRYPTDLDEQQRYALYAPWLEHEDPGVRANALICLIHQANYLLDQQIAALESQFISAGGYTEQLATARRAERGQQVDEDAPMCPKCDEPMVRRTATAGRHAGKPFWGCSAYPQCKGVVEL